MSSIPIKISHLMQTQIEAALHAARGEIDFAQGDDDGQTFADAVRLKRVRI